MAAFTQPSAAITTLRPPVRQGFAYGEKRRGRCYRTSTRQEAWLRFSPFQGRSIQFFLLNPIRGPTPIFDTKNAVSSWQPYSIPASYALPTTSLSARSTRIT